MFIHNKTWKLNSFRNLFLGKTLLYFIMKSVPKANKYEKCLSGKKWYNISKKCDCHSIQSWDWIVFANGKIFVSVPVLSQAFCAKILQLCQYLWNSSWYIKIIFATLSITYNDNVLYLHYHYLYLGYVVALPNIYIWSYSRLFVYIGVLTQALWI